MRVSVFGGSQPKAGLPAYEEAYRLGQLLGKAGHTALTGGYIGTMEAVSRGCAEAGGHVIGVTCEDIENWRRIGPNEFVKEQMRFPTLGERLTALIFNCDAAIALPGGIGTLAEIALTWNYHAIDALPERPLVLVGAGWRAVFETVLAQVSGYIPQKDRSTLTYADSVEEAFAIIQEYFARSARSA